MKINYPVFILAKDCGEVLKFDSVYEMQRQLEKIDIENSEYEGWDRDGYPLDLKVQKPVWLNIEMRSSEPQREKLIQALTKYASAVGTELKIEGMAAAEYDKAFRKINDHIKKQNASKGFLRRIIGRNT